MGFFIDVPTWRGERRALEALLSKFCMNFISRECEHAVVSILKCVVAIGEGFCKLNILS
jgi:hypothetical protein